MTEINREQLAEWANGYHCDSGVAVMTMAKMLLDFMDREKQEPVTWPDMPFSFEELEQMHGATFANGYVRGWARKCESVTMKGPLFTAPQKPVVLPKSHYVCGCADRYMSAPEVIAAIEAAGGVVKDGE